MNDDQYLERIRKSRRDAVRLFSNAGKRERELWVAEEFLKNLGITPRQGELVSVMELAPDVCYQSAAFEIKEIMDEGRKRHKEFKDSLSQAERARHPSETLEECKAMDIVYVEIADLVRVKVIALQNDYSSDFKRGTDLLFYFNLENARGFVAQPLPESGEFSSLGWRSISFLAGPHSYVLFASDTAPPFLRISAETAGRAELP